MLLYIQKKKRANCGMKETHIYIKKKKMVE